jgi:hypothetical protein
LAGGQLLMEVPGQSPKEPLFAASERKFFLRSEETEIEFSSNQKGEISSLAAKGPGGRQLKALKKR